MVLLERRSVSQSLLRLVYSELNLGCLEAVKKVG